MIRESLRILQLVITILIASQGIFYLLGTASALKKISVPAFAEQRKAIDSVIAIRLRIIYYMSLLVGVAVLIAYKGDAAGVAFVCSLIATLLLVVDAVLALKFEIPINKILGKYPDGTQHDWRSLQLSWLRFIVLRGICSSLALCCLLYSWLRS
jgi:hypothetical protein